MAWTLIGILLYLSLQFGIGWVVSRSVKTEEDYLLAGRKLGPVLTTFTVFATWFGAESVIGSSGAVYEGGVAAGTADPFGFGLCLILMGAVYAAPLWRRKLTTLADLFRIRYSKAVERIAILFMVPSTMMWAAAQIRAFGQVLSSTTGIDISVAIIAAGCIVVAYTVLGGLLAVAATDFLQGLVLITGLFILLIVMITQEPRFAEAWGSIDPSRFSFRQPESSGWLESINTWLVPICGSVVAQELVARVIAARSPGTASRGALAGGSMYILIGLIPVSLGLVAAQLFPGLENTEGVIPLLAETYLHDVLYVIFIGALISAILSTVDSALLVASSLISHNIILSLRPDTTEQRKIRSARIWVVVFGAAAVLIALRAEGVYDLVVEASSFGTAGIFTLVTFGLFLKRGGVKTALATLVVSMGLWLVGNYILELPWAYLLSLSGSLLTFFLVSAAEPDGNGMPPPVAHEIEPQRTGV